jgi:hypothetical protein
MRPQYRATILGHRLNTGGIKSLNISIIISAPPKTRTFINIFFFKRYNFKESRFD